MSATPTRRARVIKDPDHPDFPHGKFTGYSRGCRKECCLRARRRREKELILGAAPRTQGAPADRVKQARLHIEALKSDPSVGNGAIARAAKVGESTVNNIVRGRTASNQTVHRILKVTAASVSSHSRVVAAAPVLLKVRQMQALGYPVKWQEEQTGLVGIIRCALSNQDAGHQDTVEHKTAAAITALAERIGDRPADDSDGIAKGPRAFVRGRARALGYYPPAFYNEDGTLDYRAIPDHPWAATEEWCHEHIERLNVIIKNPDLGDAQLARLGNPDGDLNENEERQYGRTLDRLQLRGSHEGSAQRRAELRLALIDFYAGEGDPLTFCLDTGLVAPNAQPIAQDHPSLLAHPLHLERVAKRAASRKASKERARDKDVQEKRNAYERDRRRRRRAEASTQTGQVAA